MPSPFPGMNPLLESPVYWQSFHARLAVRLADAITPRVGPKYRADPQHAIQIVEDDWFASDEDDEDDEDDGDSPSPTASLGGGEADTTVALQFDTSGPDGGTATLAPPRAAVARGPARGHFAVARPYPSKRYYVTVRQVDRQRGVVRRRPLVTVIEILSPANKRKGGARDRYLAKRERLALAGVSFIELDLLRGGRRTPMEGRPTCDYSVSLCRRGDNDDVDIWPLNLRDRLPTIPVPLLPPDADVMLDLQDVLNGVYDAASYGFDLEWPLQVDALRPRLAKEDAEWAKAVVEAARAARERAQSPAGGGAV